MAVHFAVLKNKCILISESFYICSGKQDKNTEEDHLDQKVQYKLLEAALKAMQPSIVWSMKYTWIYCTRCIQI